MGDAAAVIQHLLIAALHIAGDLQLAAIVQQSRQVQRQGADLAAQRSLQQAALFVARDAAAEQDAGGARLLR